MKNRLFKIGVPGVVGFVIGLFFFRGCGNSNPFFNRNASRDPEIIEVVKTETKTVTVIDTVVVKEIVRVSDVIVEKEYVYDTIKHEDNYYNQIFSGDHYELQTYGGYVDSVNVEVDLVTKETVKEITIEREKTILKHATGLYLYSGMTLNQNKKISPHIGLSLNMRRMVLGTHFGYMSDIKTMYGGVSVGINLLQDRK